MKVIQNIHCLMIHMKHLYKMYHIVLLLFSDLNKISDCTSSDILLELAIFYLEKNICFVFVIIPTKMK